jgi:pectate lyase
LQASASWASEALTYGTTGGAVSESTTPPPDGGVRNIIIRNLIFTGLPDDAINIQMFAHHIWIDHSDD